MPALRIFCDKKVNFSKGRKYTKKLGHRRAFLLPGMRQLTWFLPPHSPPGRFAHKASCLPTTAPLGFPGGLTSKPHHAHRHFAGLRGSFRLRLASIFNHRPGAAWRHLLYPNPKKKKRACLFFLGPRKSASALLFHTVSPYARANTAAATLAPACSSTAPHSLSVAPVVAISSTNRMRCPAMSSAPSSRAKAPFRFSSLF